MVPRLGVSVMEGSRESMPYDVVIVGAGPAGLSCACKLKQLNSEISVCVLEKGSEVGAHILSGAILETRALDELFPNWKEESAPLETEVSMDKTLLLKNSKQSWLVPPFFTPKTMHNSGNYIASLGKLCRWLAQQAEQLGVEIFPGFAASEILFDEQGTVMGVATGDMGVAKNGERKSGFQEGMELHARYTVFSEGCRGHLGKILIARFGLDKDKDPQHYALGLKELWRIPQTNHQPGLVQHTAGWPLNESDSHGGGFLYHLEDGLVSVGLVVDLAYKNCHLSPFDEFQRYKHHPEISKHLRGGERLSYGARTIAKGGLQSQPQLHCPGALLVGDDAGTLNFAKIKGTHTAMKSGMVAAESIASALASEKSPTDLSEYQQAYESCWAHEELRVQRNFGPALQRWGHVWGGAYSFVDINIFSGALPWTLKNSSVDHGALTDIDNSPAITYPKPDGVLSFDKLSSVFLSNTNHEEDQICHLRLANTSEVLESNFKRYGEPAQLYCPAGVYELIASDGDAAPKLQINAQNCLHCKACDIKDPAQNITWVCPEGGGGPNYSAM